MKYLTIIWKFINSKFFVYVMGMVIIALVINTCAFNKKDDNGTKIINQNINANDTTIKRYIDESGKFNAEKEVWILSEKELKKQNEELYERVKKQEGDIISLNVANFSLTQSIDILHDSINFLHENSNTEFLNDSTLKVDWDLFYSWDDDNSDRFIGHSIIDLDLGNNKIRKTTTLMDSRVSKISLTFGEKVVDGKYNVFVTSKYPGLSPVSMEGFFMNPNDNEHIKSLMEKDHWFTGFGTGPALNLGYDFINSQPAFMIGWSIHYNVYQW